MTAIAIFVAIIIISFTFIFLNFHKLFITKLIFIFFIHSLGLIHLTKLKAMHSLFILKPITATTKIIIIKYFNPTFIDSN